MTKDYFRMIEIRWNPEISCVVNRDEWKCQSLDPPFCVFDNKDIMLYNTNGGTCNYREILMWEERFIYNANLFTHIYIVIRH